jgi:hypothetical protein
MTTEGAVKEPPSISKVIRTAEQQREAWAIFEPVCWCLHELRAHSGRETECEHYFRKASGRWARKCTCPYFEAKT